MEADEAALRASIDSVLARALEGAGRRGDLQPGPRARTTLAGRCRCAVHLATGLTSEAECVIDAFVDRPDAP